MSVRDEASLERWLRRLELRSELSPSDQDRVLALAGSTAAKRAGSDFVRLGENADYVSLVIDGLAGQYGQTPSGQRQLVALHLPGEMVNLTAAVLPNACCAQTALTDVKLLNIPVGALHQLMSESPSLASALWRDCALNAAVAEHWLLRNGLQQVYPRLANFLCEYALRNQLVGGHRDEFDLRLSQAAVGEVLGCTAVHTNRTIRALRETGAIEWRGYEIRILDWQKLTDIADFDAAFLHVPARIAKSAAA